MITIEISNKSNMAINNLFLIELPASGYDLQDAFEKLGIQDTNDCELVNVITSIEEVNFYFENVGFEVDDIPKLNVLVTILNGKTADELVLFSALLFKGNIQSIEKMICIAANIDDSYLKDIHTKKELGRFLVEDGYIDISEDAYDFIKYKKLAKFYLKHFDCAFTPYGFVESDSPFYEDCSSRCDTDVFDEIFEEICEAHDITVFQVALINAKDCKNEAPTYTIVSLPAEEKVLKDAAKSLGVNCVDELLIADLKGRNSFFNSRFKSNVKISRLNEFAKIIIEMDVDTFCKFKAIMECSEVIGQKTNKPISDACLAMVINEFRYIDHYDFILIADGKPLKPNTYKLTSYGYIRCLDEDVADTAANR